MANCTCMQCVAGTSCAASFVSCVTAFNFSCWFCIPTIVFFGLAVEAANKDSRNPVQANPEEQVLISSQTTVVSIQQHPIQPPAYSTFNTPTYAANQKPPKKITKLSFSEVINHEKFDQLLAEGFATGPFTRVNNREDLNNFLKKYQDCVDFEFMDNPLTFPDGQVIDLRTYRKLKQSSTDGFISHPVSRCRVPIDQALIPAVALKCEMTEFLEQLNAKLSSMSKEKQPENTIN